MRKAEVFQAPDLWHRSEQLSWVRNALECTASWRRLLTITLLIPGDRKLGHQCQRPIFRNAVGYIMSPLALGAQVPMEASFLVHIPSADS